MKIKTSSENNNSMALTFTSRNCNQEIRYSPLTVSTEIYAPFSVFIAFDAILSMEFELIFIERNQRETNRSILVHLIFVLFKMPRDLIMARARTHTHT